MLYEPKYCSNCGERIQRTETKMFSSRKFCELCKTEYKFEEFLPKAAALLLIVFGVWGFSSSFIKSEESLEVKEVSRTGEFQKNTKRALKTANLQSDISDKQDISTLASGEITPENQIPQTNVLPKGNSINTRTTDDTQKTPDVPVYFCGAETKKGTPCSRRVKGGGRCWQHIGRQAMLPAKDLIANKQ